MPDTIAGAIEQALAMDAPVEARLDRLAARVRVLDPAYAGAVDRLALRLRAVAAAAPAVGAIMPRFALPAEDGRLVTLDSLLGRGPLVVTFLRGHWCMFCRVAARGLAASERAIAAAGGHVVAITPERRRYAGRLRDEAGLGGAILSDIDNGYAMSLGLAIWMGAEIQAISVAAGRDLPRYHGNAAWLLPVPATFVLDRTGRVVARHIDPDYRRRMARDAVLAAVREAR